MKKHLQKPFEALKARQLVDQALLDGLMGPGTSGELKIGRCFLGKEAENGVCTMVSFWRTFSKGVFWMVFRGFCQSLLRVLSVFNGLVWLGLYSKKLFQVVLGERSGVLHALLVGLPSEAPAFRWFLVNPMRKTNRTEESFLRALRGSQVQVKQMRGERDRCLGGRNDSKQSKQLATASRGDSGGSKI